MRFHAPKAALLVLWMCMGQVLAAVRHHSPPISFLVRLHAISGLQDVPAWGGYPLNLDISVTCLEALGSGTLVAPRAA